METSAITSANSTPYTSGQSNRTISSDFETFLRMLTTQIQNQDPLNPVEASDFAVQLATFSSVEQQVLTNDLLKAMFGQMNLTGLAQMGDWVGRDVRVAAPVWFGGSPITLSPNPAAVADRVELVVTNAQGIEVQRLSLPLSAQEMQWAGVGSDGAPLPNGQYQFAVESWSDGNLILTETPEVYARVGEVRAEDGRLRLVLPGGIVVEAATVTALRHG